MQKVEIIEQGHRQARTSMNGVEMRFISDCSHLYIRGRVGQSSIEKTLVRDIDGTPFELDSNESAAEALHRLYTRFHAVEAVLIHDIGVAHGS